MIALGCCIIYFCIWHVFLGSNVHRPAGPIVMDIPVELLGEQGTLPGSGRGRGISIFQSERSASSEPLFRVKRWRREPAPRYVDPSPKASATSPKSVLNRFDGQGLGAHYKPFSNGPLNPGGLMPPPLRCASSWVAVCTPVHLGSSLTVLPMPAQQ